MERNLDIPLPVTEENRDQYFEELSNISEAENWVERHSIQHKTNQDEIKIVPNDNSTNEKIVIVISFVILWLILTLAVAFFFVPALIVMYLLG